MSVEEVLTEVLKYKSYYERSGGGVTFSGGEPMDQPEFLAELAKASHEHGLHVTLDTSGCATAETAELVLPHVDLLLLDIKTINPDTYLELTKQPLDTALVVLDIARRLKVPTWIRFVLVPGITDDVDDLHKLAEFLRPYENIEKIEVLPFHKSGEYKWEDLGIPYELHDTPSPTREQIRQAKEILCRPKK